LTLTERAEDIDEGWVMSTTTRLSFEEFLRLPDDDNSYELNEGELLVTPSPTPFHSVVRIRLTLAIKSFVKSHDLGLVLDETDFRLAPNTVRRPDVAFLSRQMLKGFDFDRSPIEGAPTLAIEIISPSNSAQDMLLKVHQYIDAGCQAVWVFYPLLSLVAVHNATGMHEVKGVLEEQVLFGASKLTLSLAEIFDRDYTK
jgi:Uma2 family endonuclease